MKRLRRLNGKKRISYFHCGEYGEACRTCRRPQKRCICSAYTPGLGRPHFHALLFGHWFPDQLPYKKGADGSPLFTSATLQRLWTMGFSTIGAVTFDSAAYCARYVMKKISGEPAEKHYEVIEPETGELVHLLPEYVTMSLKPAIGKEWFEAFSNDVYPEDFVVMQGRKMKPPRYYDKLHETLDQVSAVSIKQLRAAFALAHKDDNTPERLRVREKVKLAHAKTLKREIE